MAKKVKPQVVAEPTSTIITYNGKTADRSQCRLINGKYYKIGNIDIKDSGDCYLIEDTYYRISTGKIAWDYEVKFYNFIENMVKGYVPDNEKIGYFTRNFMKNYPAEEGLYVLDDHTVAFHSLKYDYQSGTYYNINREFVMQPTRQKPEYASLPTNIYGMGEYPGHLMAMIASEYQKTFENTEKNVFDKFFFGYKYGLEIETDMGWWPENQYYKYGCVPLKDGSILGTEITTIPQSPKFNLFKDLFKSISKYTGVTHNNSLHVNISGFKNTPEFRVALYVMYYRLQQEINAFIPIYKRELPYLVNKQGGAKDHCKPLERLGIVHKYTENPDSLKQEIDYADIEIFKFLNEGVYDSSHNIKSRKHRREGGHKWDYHNRYYALNLMPLYFGNVSASRIEYRVHSGTVNPYKSLIWLLITAAITKFVENNAIKVLSGKDKINLEDILKETYLSTDTEEGLFLFKYISSYIAMREKENSNIVVRADGEIYGNEFTNDRLFAFKPNGSDLLTYEPKNKGT